MEILGRVSENGLRVSTAVRTISCSSESASSFTFVRERVGSSYHKPASINPYADLGAFRAGACYALSQQMGQPRARTVNSSRRNGGLNNEIARKILRIEVTESDIRGSAMVKNMQLAHIARNSEAEHQRRAAKSPNDLARSMRQEQCGMNAPSRISGPAKKILLATDLSARCDRALYRAAMLAKQWQSSLIVLHVVEDRDLSIPDEAGLPSWRRPRDPIDTARKHLLADVDALPARPAVRVAEGNPVEAILGSAGAENCDLIAIGVGRGESLGHFVSGRTADRLFRRSRLPLLVVKGRPRRPYENIVFATDLSDSSRYALETAARFFSGQRLTIFHAYSPPSGLITKSALRRQYRMEVEQEVRAFLAEVDKSAPGWQQPHVLIEDGAPNLLLRDYVRDKEVDLLVLGTHGRSAFFEIFLGSVAKAIVDDVPCDALVIRKASAAIET